MVFEYLKAETSSTVGKLNLALVVLLLVFGIPMCIPPILVTVLRMAFKTEFPAWVYAIPLVAFVSVCIVAVTSLFLIYKEGQQSPANRGSPHGCGNLG